MKKLIFIILLFLYTLTANAETILSDDYYLEGENPIDYPFKLDTDYIKADFSDWTSNIVEAKPNRVIEERNVTKYRSIKPIRYLLFNNFVTSNNYLELAELDLFIDNVEINYNFIIQVNCNILFGDYLQDGNTYQNYASVHSSGMFIIDLGTYYDINQLTIDFYMNDMGLNPKSFDLYVGADTNFNEYYFYKRIMIYFISNPDVWEMNRYRIIPEYSWINNQDYIYNDYIYGDVPDDISPYSQIYNGIEYRYYDIKYRYYKIFENNIVQNNTVASDLSIDTSINENAVDSSPVIQTDIVNIPMVAKNNSVLSGNLIEDIPVNQSHVDSQAVKLTSISPEIELKASTSKNLSWLIIFIFLLIFMALISIIYYRKKSRIN